ncbi:MAG: DEAD/DEAH box helicase family protein [Verrucomicrobia bacterium]|nr:DEAD/DEAH box helicase family protein [Verrucomicrobiota bacterium]MCH8528730.1 SNF2 family helicase [Kiritimatiellia bacterium]
MLPFSREKLLEWAGPDVFRRAELLVDSERVRRVAYKDRKIEGLIEARPRDILTSMAFPEGEVAPDNLCPCRENREMGLICHHVVALCLEYLNIINTPERKAMLEEERRKAERMARTSEDEYLTRVPEGTPGAIPVRLCLHFPADLRSRWWTDSVPVEIMVEHKGEQGSIRNIRPELKLAMPEREDNVLFVLEDIAGGPVPPVMELGPRDLANVLELMVGLRIWIGGQAGGVMPGKVPVAVTLELEDDTGMLALDLETRPPEGLEEQIPAFWANGKKAWALIGTKIFLLDSVLPAPLWALYKEPIRIHRPDVPRFIRREMEVLASLTTLRTDVDPDWFSFQPEAPGFRLEVRGSPASLAATLYARYGGMEWIAGVGGEEEDFVTPDPENILHYRTRNIPAERAALDLLRPLGFGGDRGDKMEAIVGKSGVMNFCASSVPMLRRRGWKVELQGRIADALEDAETLMPVIQVADGGSGWFDIDCEFETREGESLQLSDIRQALAAGDAYVQRGDRMLLFDRDAVKQMVDLFEDCGGKKTGNGVRMPAVHGAFLKATLDGLDGVDVEAAPEWLQRVEAQNHPAKLEPVAADPGLNASLRPYQQEGLNWLRFMERSGFAGILADEMGLGKTLQTLAWLQLQRADERFRGKPLLIICPTSLVENWIDEGTKFTPSLSFLNLTGSPAQRDKAWKTAGEYDVWVISYSVLQRDLARYVATEFAVVVLDEAQHIKNRTTQNAKAVKKLRACTRLVLTGTPVENSVSDLWSIMDFLMPGYLGLHEKFRHRYELPIKAGGPEAEEAQKRLRKKLQPFLLRRLKKDVAKDLPPKIEKIAYCRMTQDQTLVYKELVRQSQQKLESMVASQGFQKSRMEILTVLMRLRQACCHLDLLKLPGVKSQAPSGKLDLFKEMMMEAVDGGHRVLVFSQFTSMLSILRAELEKMEMSCCYLDGSTKNRMDVVRRFQGDQSIPVFLISLKAGGTGLNLTGADMVIHYDPWWNPAVENQATDRAYRIGQQRNVYSMKMITRDSVEEKVLALQQRKQAVIDATLDTDSQVMQSLEWEDVQELLRM